MWHRRAVHMIFPCWLLHSDSSQQGGQVKPEALLHRVYSSVPSLPPPPSPPPRLILAQEHWVTEQRWPQSHRWQFRSQIFRNSRGMRMLYKQAGVVLPGLGWASSCPAMTHAPCNVLVLKCCLLALCQKENCWAKCSTHPAPETAPG